MKPAHAALAASCLLVAPLLAGCGAETARTIGLTRDAPDEFAVTTRAPLSMPPMLGQLPPPRPGAARPQEVGARNQAEAALGAGGGFGTAGRATAPTAAEQALLAQTGRGAPSDIRATVDSESTRLDRGSRGVVDRVLFGQSPSAAGIPVDPARESQRLRENAALGRDPSDGQTAIIQPQRRGWFSGWRLW